MVNAATVAIENARLHERVLSTSRIEQELSDARAIQQSFLPSSELRLDGYSVFTHYEAAASVGGDYVGWAELPGGKVAVAVGDVSGKGLPAALMMARLSGDVRTALAQHDEPAEALHAINVSLRAAAIDSRFVTMLLMILDVASGDLALANAGHPRPFVRETGGSVRELGEEGVGIPLNITTDSAFRPATVRVPLAPGATVLAYTDGVSEAQGAGRELFGTERIATALRGAPDAVTAGNALLRELAAFTEGHRQNDDTTLVALGRNG